MLIADRLIPHQAWIFVYQLYLWVAVSRPDTAAVVTIEPGRCELTPDTGGVSRRPEFTLGDRAAENLLYRLPPESTC